MPPLLFDENLSPRLSSRLAASFPGSRHVRDMGLVGGSDLELWTRAAREGLVLVSKDDDFRQLSFLRGAPPKVVWLVVGNAKTEQIARLLEDNLVTVDRFEESPEEALLVLRMPREVD